MESDIEVVRRLVMEGFWPEAVFPILARPDVLAGLLSRLRSFAISERQANRARLAIAIAIGRKFGTVRFTGDLHWKEPDEILFQVHDPLPADVRWNLRPVDAGTLVQVMVWLDLYPWLGPMAYLVPKPIVREMIGSDLEHALKKIATVLNTEHPPQSCPFPELCLLHQPSEADPATSHEHDACDEHDGNRLARYEDTENRRESIAP